MLDRLLRRKPELSVSLSSGYTDKKSQQTAIREKEIPFIQKPFSLVDLFETISEVIG